MPPLSACGLAARSAADSPCAPARAVCQWLRARSRATHATDSLQSTYAQRARSGRNPDAEIAGTALRKWVKWDCGLEPGAYATRLRAPGSWGGALEMAIIAEMKNAIVHVRLCCTRMAGLGLLDRRAPAVSDPQARSVCVIGV